jgi:hypothetical protein
MQPDLPEPLRDAWGLRSLPDALEIAPALASGTPGLEASRLRVGRTLLDVAFRVRGDRALVRIARRFGPPLVVRVRLRGGVILSTLVDEVPVGGDVASLVVEATHDVTFYLG